MTPATFRLVLVISFAHALVHVFELALPSVEQMIGDEFQVGKEVTGNLGMAWRLPFGLGAFFAGWLTDKFGSKRLLLIYLFGCIATSILTCFAVTLGVLFAAMFVMGCFASIYHPAGLALISRETTAENRGAALGWHGIIGSIGIASAPFWAGMIFSTGVVTWRQYYLVLSIPAVVIAVLLFVVLPDSRRETVENDSAGRDLDADERSDWRAYSLLVLTGALTGFVYAAFMHFLPRYLSNTGMQPSGISDESARNYLAAVVLSCAVVAQAIAGKLARPGRLEIMLTLILFGNAPCLAWMAVAEGKTRVFAACALALVHFMNQPVYNSLIAQYVPRSRLSLGYGFSNLMCFGIGALGPAYAGFMQTDAWTYGGLAVVAALAATISLTLLMRRRPVE